MGENSNVYPYIPNSVPHIKAEMLKEVGARSEIALYQEIPEALRYKGQMKLPPGMMDEFSIKHHTEKILAKNKNCAVYANFLGAGCARHFVPAVCDEIVGRGELLTCYGAESWGDHGKHQIFFEYQSMLVELLGMDFTTVPQYDGGQSAATAFCMAHRMTGRKKILIPRTMNPQHLSLARNYCQGMNDNRKLSLIQVDYDPETGLMDLDDLKTKISPEVAAVFVENPTFLGSIEIQVEEIGAMARDAGAEFIVYTDPISLFSHPCDAGAPATAGYKVITLMPDKNGYPDLEALKSVLSDRTAAIFVTNPEDTGIFNPRIREYVDAAHGAGALCYYDQANVNGIMGITRAKEAGFDVIHYNLHKTFSSPHGGMGPGCGALGVTQGLKKYLPVPRVEFDGTHYCLNHDYPDSIGRLRSFLGNIHIVIRAYMWIMQMGEEGIREAAVCSVLNNQYLMKKISEIPGVSIWYAPGKRRLEQCRYSWEKLKADTGFGTEDVTKRLIDFGMEHYWTSHHPWVVPEPFTLEPCESYSKDDIDEYVAILRQISKECYENPEIIRNAPHNAPIHNIEHYFIDEYAKIAATWKQWKKRRKQTPL